jgi:predicted Zn-dependent peptidase
MRVILSPDPGAATVSVDVWYDVGARDERPGRTGLAHLFEHMMFQGSANVGKGEHMSFVTYNPQSCFGYAHPGIGTMADLDSAKLEDVRAFHSTYYRPNLATLTLTGGFDPAEARRLIQQYFSDIPAGMGEVPRNECTQPFSHLPVRRTFQDANAQLPALWIAYGIPGPAHADMPAIQVLNAVLAREFAAQRAPGKPGACRRPVHLAFPGAPRTRSGAVRDDRQRRHGRGEVGNRV